MLLQSPLISLPELTHDLEMKELEARQQGKGTTPDEIRGVCLGVGGGPESTRPARAGASFPVCTAWLPCNPGLASLSSLTGLWGLGFELDNPS